MSQDRPDASTRKRLLDDLAWFVAKGGAARLLLPPVEPGRRAFPEPWAATKAGAALLLRRLAWHAGLDRAIEIEDRRGGAPVSERKPTTRLELHELRRTTATFALGFIGDDDIAGTFAHEIGVAHAVLNPTNDVDPYRSSDAPVLEVDPEKDLERGSVATVYLGLGVLAANAALQHHAILERTDFNPMLVLERSVGVTSGYVPVESLTYLLAVQAAVRGDTTPPPGLSPEQQRQVAAYLDNLDRHELRERLGIAADAVPGTRPAVEPFADAALVPDDLPRKTAFRWTTSRKGIGFLTGTVVGIGTSMAAFPTLMPFFAAAGIAVGFLIGHRVRVTRCSACATVVRRDATVCAKCGAALRGDIADLSERLAAEERLTDGENA